MSTNNLYSKALTFDMHLDHKYGSLETSERQGFHVSASKESFMRKVIKRFKSNHWYLRINSFGLKHITKPWRRKQNCQKRIYCFEETKKNKNWLVGFEGIVSVKMNFQGKVKILEQEYDALVRGSMLQPGDRVRVISTIFNRELIVVAI